MTNTKYPVRFCWNKTYQRPDAVDICDPTVYFSPEDVLTIYVDKTTQFIRIVAVVDPIDPTIYKLFDETNYANNMVGGTSSTCEIYFSVSNPLISF